jgi:hypothetical protein
MKSEVYSWRLSAEKKLALEAEARREGKSVAEVLDEMSSRWLEQKRAAGADDDAEQARLHEKVRKLAGSLSGGDPERSSKASARVKEILAEKYGRRPR